MKNSIKMALAAVVLTSLIAGCGGGGSGGGNAAPPSTAVSVAKFSPAVNVVGGVVVIDGNNFDANNAANNVVKFNGVAATILNATANRIVATVPNSATNGPVSVTVGGQTSTSTNNFVVSQLALSIGGASLNSSTYSTSTPGAVGGTYDVSLSNPNASAQNVIYVGLSNSKYTTDLPWMAADGYQPLTLGIVLPAGPFVDNTGSFSTYTGLASFIIEPTPAQGIDYSKPTYIIFTLCTTDFDNLVSDSLGNKGPSTVYIQKAVPITITN